MNEPILSRAEEWRALRRLSFRITGWPIAAGFLVVCGAGLSRSILGFPQEGGIHGSEFFIVMMPLVGALLWVPVAGLVWAHYRHSREFSGYDTLLLATNATGLALFFVMYWLTPLSGGRSVS